LTRKRIFLAASAACLLAVAILGVILVQERLRRHAVFRPSHPAARVAKELPPVERWTDTFRSASPQDLDAMLDTIEMEHPDLYARWSLAYLHARALIELNEKDEARGKLGPYLAKGHPLRDRALYHASEIADDEEASELRLRLIREHPGSTYRAIAIEDELDELEEIGDVEKLMNFGSQVEASAPTDLRREIGARIVETLAGNEQFDSALTRGLAILRGGTDDDAADRVVRALDEPQVVSRLDPNQLLLFGETSHKHRRFDRASALLSSVLQRVYSDDLQFSLGRSYFGAERFAEAQAAYLRGAGATKKPEQKAVFFWHAARAAQLAGDDATAEKHMTSAIAVKGKFAATTAALTQRMRTRLRHGRLAEAASDLALMKKMAGGERAFLEASLAYAVAMVAGNRMSAATATLNSIPPKLANETDRAELAYWRGRAAEATAPNVAVDAYLDVLRAESSPFQKFARDRVLHPATPALSRALREARSVRDAQAAKLVAAKQYELARRVQRDRVLLAETDRELQLEKLASIERQIPEDRAVLDLTAEAFPRFPEVDPKDEDALLMAMGLFDETVPAIESRWGLRPARAALTRSLALNEAGAAKASIYAVEVMMNRVPDGFVYELLPQVVRELLYPRYFARYVEEDSRKYDVDPALVYAIMREESRFDPRAKSQVAARGLLQFIITTARDIGRDIGLVDLDPEDLYDPRVIIHLGAKYLHELGEQFDGNPYRVAAAYNAGPKQVALWTRMQSAPGDDYFVSAVNFDETKGYVRKVMGSYERYAH
jgi:soluble lytic murein transglycosylase-like protein